MPDREKYIEVLSKTAETVKEYNDDVPIKISLECIEDILELLKDQEIVRCKDCWKKDNPYLCRFDRDLEEHGSHRTEAYDAWFCADGERRTDDA